MVDADAGDASETAAMSTATTAPTLLVVRAIAPAGLMAPHATDAVDSASGTGRPSQIASDLGGR